MRTRPCSRSRARAAAEYQDQHGQPITRDAPRARLGVSNQAAFELLRSLREHQRLVGIHEQEDDIRRQRHLT